MSDRTVPLIGVDMLSEAVVRRGVGQCRRLRARRFHLDWRWSGIQDRRSRAAADQRSRQSNTRCAACSDEDSGETIVMDLAPARARSRPRTAGPDSHRSAARPLHRRMGDSVRRALPDGVAVAREGAHTDENRRMLAAFRWNLRVLSYVALAVGAFLIYNTISVSVVRRRLRDRHPARAWCDAWRRAGGISGRSGRVRFARSDRRDRAGTIDGRGRGQAGGGDRGIAVRQQPARRQSR